MTTAVQRRRGTNTEHATFTGLDGEITVNTTTYTLHVHDGATVGGIVLAKADGSNIVTSSIDINGGTIDGTVIGGSSAAAGTFTSITGTSANINGTVTADGLTVDGNIAFSNASSSPQINSNLSIVFNVDADNNDPNDKGYFFRRHSAAENIAFFDENGDISFYEDTGTTAKFFWDASAESLGIGTSSPSSYNAGGNRLVVGSGSGFQGMTIASGNAQSGNIYFADGTTGDETYRGHITYDHSDDHMHFKTAGSERMRIDSSGNLLVGKTTTSNATAGAELNASGQIVGTFASGTHILGRNTNDGSILEFQKNGSPVGSIGTLSGSLSISDSDTGLYFNRVQDNILPFNGSTNAVRDNAIDLGRATARFKDLYLSGGVYLGGTGTANKLDDYEEGTFTPAFRNVTATYASGSTTGQYVKVGRMVYYTAVITTDSLDTADTDSVEITLPFASTAGQAYFSPVTLFVEEGFNDASAEAYQAIVVEGQSYLRLYSLETPSTSTNYNILTYQDLTGGVGGTRLRFSGAYLT